jgi:glycosyltransferase involved in cell wall biosynthesis
MIDKLRKRARNRLRTMTPQPAVEMPPVLDLAFYGKTNPDVTAAGVDPAGHFWTYGAAEGRSPNSFFSHGYVHSHLDQSSLSGPSEVSAYIRSGLFAKPRLIFVSHDASRTGAPAIILRLLEMFSRSGLFECFSILDEGGERLPEFKALSHTHVMTTSRRGKAWSDGYASRELQDAFRPDGLFHGNMPVCALVNSTESFHIGRALAEIGVPVVSLIHEIASYYPPEVFASIVSYSRKSVFPSQFVSRVAASHAALDLSATTIRGQGLLEDDFGVVDRHKCRRLLRERLGVGDDAFIVLNVGTVDIRKGADMFIETARLFLEDETRDRPVYFVWFGMRDAAFGYVDDVLTRHDLSDRIRFLPSTAAIEQVFAGGDLFFLSARADPFPCVIHEAMACGLPVIAFRNGGGAPELVGDACGTVVEMGDLAAAAAAIGRYVDDPDLRERQAAAARDHIRSDWDYRSYCDDIYRIIRDTAGRAPKCGWPDMPALAPEDHLVVIEGCLRDLRLLDDLHREMPIDEARIVLIDGRFGQEADEVIAGLTARRWRYRVCQPEHDTTEARRTQLLALFKNPKPRRVTLVNTLGCLTDHDIGPLAFPIRAVETAGTLSAGAVYPMLPYLEQLRLSDALAAARLWSLNPLAEGRVSIWPNVHSKQAEGA